VLKRLDDEKHVKSMILKDGTAAMQYVFMYDSYYDLIDECEGKVWVEERKWDEQQKELSPSSGKAWFRTATH
jgi:hypothetical protein